MQAYTRATWARLMPLKVWGSKFLNAYVFDGQISYDALRREWH